MRIKQIFLLLLLVGLIATPVSALAAEILCVTAARANLRVGPGPENRISWEVNQFTPLLKVGEQDEWIKVKDVDGDIHWIFSKLLSNKVQCVTIKSERANIREKASSKSRKIFSVEKYTSFKQVGKAKDWVQIQYENGKMWVFHSLVWPSP